MTHLFRPADPAVVPTPPVGTCRRDNLAGAVAQLLARLRDIMGSQELRHRVRIALLLLGTLAQAISFLFLAHLVDLSLSLMELWTELARKHLEITL